MGAQESHDLHLPPQLRGFNVTSHVRRGCRAWFEKESLLNDTLLHFVEFSNVLNSGRSSSATLSNLMYKDV